MAKKKIFNAGLLKHKVTLLFNKEGYINDRGMYIDGEMVEKIVKAYISTYSNSILAYKASDISADSPTIKILIRYVEGITLSDKVNVNGTTYTIKKITNYNLENKFLELEVDL